MLGCWELLSWDFFEEEWWNVGSSGFFSLVVVNGGVKGWGWVVFFGWV